MENPLHSQPNKPKPKERLSLEDIEFCQQNNSLKDKIRHQHQQLTLYKKKLKDSETAWMLHEKGIYELYNRKRRWALCFVGSCVAVVVVLVVVELVVRV